jgi:hypothetical protein
LTGTTTKTATLTLSAGQIDVGTRTITAQYLGNGTHNESVSNGLSLTVNQAVLVTEVITAAGTFNVPAGVTFLIVEAWGGGGGGFRGKTSGGGKGGG